METEQGLSPADLTDLTNQIREVATSRVAKASLDQQVKDSRAAWETENQVLIDQQNNQRITLEGCEAKLRGLTIEAYELTGNKQPVPGVGIRETTKLGYDEGVAFAWAVEHKLALKFDKPAFEKIVKASPQQFTSVSISITTEFQATLIRALAAFIALSSTMSGDIIMPISSDSLITKS